MKRPKNADLRVAAHALTWAHLGYAKPHELDAIERTRQWLLDITGYEPRPHLDADNFALYCVTTGRWYKTHLNLVRLGVGLYRWREHLRRCHREYCREVEPAWLLPPALWRTARHLRAHYTREIADLARNARE